MLLLIFAHPYLDRSRANQALLSAVSDLDGLELRSLYELYPGFDIDVQAEQAALARAKVVVWQHPIYWYAPPGLLKHWFDKVLLRGWAYGEGGEALKGKRCQWVATTGGETQAYSSAGMHGFEFERFVGPVEQTARFCGMGWEPPFVVHGSHKLSEAALTTIAGNYRSRLQSLIDEARRST